MDYDADITANSEEVCLAFRAKLITLARTLAKTLMHTGRLLPKKTDQQGGRYFLGIGFGW